VKKCSEISGQNERKKSHSIIGKKGGEKCSEKSGHQNNKK